MKNRCWLNPVQQYKQKIILITLAIIASFIGSLLGVLTFGVPNTAFADYQDIIEDQNAIVNFNQQFNNTLSARDNYNGITFSKDNYTYSVSGSFTSYNLYLPFTTNGVTYVNLISGHIYYIDPKLNVISGNSPNLILSNGSTHYIQNIENNLYTSSVNASAYFGFWHNVAYTYDFNVTPMIIDLSQMFGSGNEPSLVQCQNLFVADYYAYNTGSSVSLSGLDSYSQGVQSVYDTLTYNYVAEDSYNLLESYAFYRGATYYNGAPSKEQSHISVAALDGDGWVSGNGFALYYPFNSSLVAGDTIVLNGMLGSATDYGTHQQATTYIIIRYGDNVYDVLNVNSIVLQDATTNNINSFTYTLPSDATGLVFYSLQPFRIKDFTIQVKSLSINNLIDNAYKNGVEKGSNPYQVGNNGYNAIYEAGRQQGIDDAGNYTFLGLISAVVDTPINAVLNMLDFDLLGVNMKAFYLSLFTFCIIVFIVKLII